MDWTTPKAYIDAPSLLDIDYCHALFCGCNLSGLGAYDWIAFCEETGLEDDGDYFDHAIYPEINS